MEFNFIGKYKSNSGVIIIIHIPLAIEIEILNQFRKSDKVFVTKSWGVTLR